ncbi:hypothetical protein I5677_07300 [Mobilitalea sibirica]|uniref:Uncharacterized protein n=1 Tax=Mobilitalea sibirica TaxID=1462919 RepID=A0A8J7GYN7_9FIRM|nr:permease prefix domain 1-containing protein [Mobilitalea sibirica]MBH1940689.1 hypothetical protein [Mobilitalea sibirica]
METIKNYLDNMFAGLPNTEQMKDLKHNMLSNMEDKYNELKASGKSENEAIGIVISEFGNIDELINELGIKKDTTTDNKPMISQSETDAYLTVKKTMGLQIGIGVFLCALAPAALILITKLQSDGLITGGLSEKAGSLLGLIPLFLLITIAVAIFIYSGMNFERYKYIEEGVNLPSSVEANLKRQHENYTQPYYLSVILGVCLLILSPIALFVTNLLNNDYSGYGVVVLLGIVAVAIFILIYFGTIRESYNRLLRLGDYSEKKQKENKVIGAVASIVWPLAVLIFLLTGFIYGYWHINWIIFPVTGILFGMFSAVYNILKGNEN